jgi:nicotinate-nucleotide adenylyltransferase
MGGRRIGAYGGTFDPIHNGHVEIARAVARNFELDLMLIIPAHCPPHKKRGSVSGSYHRYAMAVLATLDEPRQVVSTIEIDAPDKPYTFETIERIRGLYGREAKLFFVMGADSFAEINTWREPKALLASTNLIVASRPGAEITTSHLPAPVRSRVRDLRGGAGESLEQIEADSECCLVYLTDYVTSGVSSTEIRRRVRGGEPINEMVPPRVAAYIEKYGLYG